jgi:hypothetical protein
MRRKLRPAAPDPRPQWMIDQGNACGCRGTDDMCPCQNVATTGCNSPGQPKAVVADHASDCAVHNEPAYPNGPCNCGAE